MTIRLLGGLAKGFVLNVEDSVTRPTSILLKRRIFDWQQEYHGINFVDCCSGSGSIGIEAWSRGAKEVFLIEADRQAFQNLQRTIANLGKKYSEELKKRPIWIEHTPFEQWTDFLKGKNSLGRMSGPVIFFIDPPYENKVTYQKIVDVLAKKLRQEVETSLWIEYENNIFAIEEFIGKNSLEKLKSFEQGRRSLLISRFS